MTGMSGTFLSNEKPNPRQTYLHQADITVFSPLAGNGFMNQRSAIQQNGELFPQKSLWTKEKQRDSKQERNAC